MEYDDQAKFVMFSTVAFVLGLAIENVLTGPLTVLVLFLWVPMGIVHIFASLAYFRANMFWPLRSILHLVVCFAGGVMFFWLSFSMYNGLNLGGVQLVEGGILTQAGWRHILGIVAIYSGISLASQLFVVAVGRRVLS
ncbi:hypothetical protein RHODOSMS8_03521 [Rhodobiaceae bacterium]|nr:hypothetical protein RHODOSMS8_03521 [Rhodobiaceae bacterium]